MGEKESWILQFELALFVLLRVFSWSIAFASSRETIPIVMKPNAIHTAAGHEVALAHIARLMDAAPGSPQEEELDLWARVVEKYEEEHFIISTPLHPIGTPPPSSPGRSS